MRRNQNRHDTGTQGTPLTSVDPEIQAKRRAAALRAAQTRRMIAILKELFPRGLNANKIWNTFAPILNRQEQQHLSVEKLEVIAVFKFKLKRRIEKFFPTRADQLRIVLAGDMDMLRRITQDTWSFADSHEVHAQDAFVIHGPTAEAAILDWAAQSVVTMLLRYIKVSV